MNFPALIFWLVILCSFWARPGTVLVLLLASLPFASLSLLPIEITGGMTLLPQMMFAVVLILKVVSPHAMTLSPKFLSTLQLRSLGYLTIFLLIGIVATLIMPRLFLGQVVVFPTRVSWIADLLSPSQANFTQSGYVTLSVMTALAVTMMADEPGFTGTLLKALLAGGTVCVVTGLIDVAAASTGMESLLEPFRNAEYSLLTNDAVGSGMRKVVGLTPEASAYGPICVEFAAAIGLLRTVYAEGHQRMYATIVAVSLVLMALLSTSSTAYGGLAVLGLVYAAHWVRRAAYPSALAQSGILGELLVGLSLIIALLLILIAHANLLNPLLNLIDEQIFNKPQTSSFYERSLWNSTAWDALVSTWGLGIGFGSTRTSSWFAAVVSGAGFVGAAFMGVFLVQTLARRSISRIVLSVEIMTALKLSLVPALVMVGITAPGPDFGLWIGGYVWRDHRYRSGPPAQFIRSCSRGQASDGSYRRALGNREPSPCSIPAFDSLTETARSICPHRGLRGARSRGTTERDEVRSCDRLAWQTGNPTTGSGESNLPAQNPG